jgi:hypothetical protein
MHFLNFDLESIWPMARRLRERNLEVIVIDEEKGKESGMNVGPKWKTRMELSFELIASFAKPRFTTTCRLLFCDRIPV